MEHPSQCAPIVGAHTSTAGGLHNALLEGHAIGASTVQIFTSNQKQWKGRVITEDISEKWQETLAQTKLSHIMSHNNYLTNLGSNKPELLEKSRLAFIEEIQRCRLLEIDYLNFHPGAATGASEESCLQKIIENLLSFKPYLDNGKLTLLLETTAGQGTTVGYCFEHLKTIIDAVKGDIPIGVCIDTCHIFAAGYDIRTSAGWELTLEEFNQKIGIDRLRAFHINDSLTPLGSRKDRHANLGKGEIGIKSFEYLMQIPKLQLIPKYLETPNGHEMWQDEIKMLKQFAQ